MNSAPIVWTPDDETRARAQLSRFLKQCGLASFESLHARSIDDVAWFTSEVIRFLELEFDQPYKQVLDISRGIEWPTWCAGGRLNITRNTLDRYLGSEMSSQPAVIWEGEEGNRRTLSYEELHVLVSTCAGGLRSLGLGKGDAIGIHLPMMPETVVALLAIGRIGAIAVPLFSGYGPSAIESRLRDVEAKAIFTCDSFPRRGIQVEAKLIADQALERCPAVRHVIVVERSGRKVELVTGRDVRWASLLETGTNAGTAMRGIEITDAEDALLVLYTSGTTGKPKGIVHSHCGFPVKAAQDMAFGTDVGRATRIAWITDLGWMMGPWLIYGATLLGATMVLYDGAHDYPDAGRIWSFCSENRVEVLGISPTLVRSLMSSGEAHHSSYDLSRLRIFGSTGEPWNPDPWMWLFEEVGKCRIPIINYSGGTEISGGIVMSNPLLPIKPCAFSAPCPGIAADVVDDECRPVRGTVGELIIRKPWIGMARGFWKDDERFLQTYWSRWPGVWAHGDWALIDEDRQWFILGRSDDTLKIAGKRVGPAEVESILVSHEMVAEAAVIGIPDDLKGTVMVAFCVLTTGSLTSDELAGDLKRIVGTELGKPLRPEKVIFVEALPKTRNAKVMRRVIRAAYLGEDPGDITALENPEAVDAIRKSR